MLFLLGLNCLLRDVVGPLVIASMNIQAQTSVDSSIVRVLQDCELRGVGCQQSAGAAVNRSLPRVRVGSSCAELPREPLGVAGGADRAVEVEGFPQRPAGR